MLHYGALTWNSFEEVGIPIFHMVIPWKPDEIYGILNIIISRALRRFEKKKD